MDIFSPEKRSLMMGRIRGRDTQPEMSVRRYLHRTGLRFKVNDKALPGRPDVVLPRYACVVFIHGCFWHRHIGCRFSTTPKSRFEFWHRKFCANKARDQRNGLELRRLRWRVLVIWGCEAVQPERLDELFWQIVSGEAAR